MRPRISIRRSVRPSVRRSVGWSVRRSVRNQLFSKLKNEGFSSCILSGRPRSITEMYNCISIGRYVCWSVHLSMFKVEKKVQQTHLSKGVFRARTAPKAVVWATGMGGGGLYNGFRPSRFYNSCITVKGAICIKSDAITF